MYIRRLFLISLISILLLAAGSVPLAPPAARAAPPAQSSPTPQNTSLLFIENVGQFAADARFQVRGTTGGALWLADDALWVTTMEHKQTVNLKLSFPDANPHSRLEPFDLRDTVFNYYHGNDPAHWYADVPVWGGVRYVDLYPGVDLEITGQGNQFAWRLVVRPPFSSQGEGWGGGLRLSVEGSETVTVQDGYLSLTTAAGDLALPLLTIKNAIPDGQPQVLNVEEQIFDVLTPFSPFPSLPSLLSAKDNPSDLLWSTFLGGSSADEAKALAVGPDGTIYVTGDTSSSDFPTSPGTFDSSFDGDDEMFVTRLNANGSDLLYSTFLGGASAVTDRPDERAWDIVVDGDGAAYITGETRTDDFPTTPSAYDTTYDPGYAIPGDPPETNPFVTKLDSLGALAYSTYLGPTSEGMGIAVDGAGMIYVTGRTGSEWFPTTDGAYDRSLAFSGDFFVLKLNPAGQGQSDLLYSTYVGLEAQDFPQDIAIDEAGVVYVTGYTQGEFPTTAGAYNTTSGSVVFFKLDPADNGAADLLYSTYLGRETGLNECGYGIAVDAAGVVYLTGSTWSTDWPTTAGAYDTTYNGNGDAFVSKLNPAGNGAADLLYSTYLGGAYTDNGGHAIAVDDAGDVYVTGETYSSDFPVTPGAFQAALIDYADVFVTRLRPQGAGQADLVYSTFLGGHGVDRGRNIVVGQDETVYVAGQTRSLYFPTTEGAYDTIFGGGTCHGYPCYDVFVARLQVKPSYSITGQVLDGDGQPLSGVQISAGGTYSAATAAGGVYTLTVPAGAYTLTPPPGYLWSPETRTVTAPPSATGQDFTGHSILKESAVPSQQALGYGEPLTYTVYLSALEDRALVLYDPVPTYTAYISGSLSASAGVVYYTATHAISGTLHLTASCLTTVTFAVQVAVTGTAEAAPRITNRACVYPPGGGLADCEWSNEVLNFTYVWPVYLPLVLKN